MTPDVLQSPALELLLRLEREGIQVTAVNERVFARPLERLTSADRNALRELKTDVLVLLRIVDDGVQRRREAFAAQLLTDSQALIPNLAVRQGIIPTAGQCVSCGDALESPRYGKCWRCCLAWRLALGVPIASPLEAMFDEAPRLAS